MNNFSVENPIVVTFEEDTLINLDSIQKSLYRIANALEVMAGIDND